MELPCGKFKELTDLRLGTLVPPMCLVCGRHFSSGLFEEYVALVEELQSQVPSPQEPHRVAHKFFDERGVGLPERACCRAAIAGCPELLEMIARLLRRPRRDVLDPSENTLVGTYFHDVKPKTVKWLLEPAPMPPLLASWASERTAFSIVYEGCRECLFGLINHIKSKKFEKYILNSRFLLTVNLEFCGVGNVIHQQGTAVVPIFGKLSVRVNNSSTGATSEVSCPEVLLGYVPVAPDHESAVRIDGASFSPIMKEIPAHNCILVLEPKKGRFICSTVSRLSEGWCLSRSVLPFTLCAEDAAPGFCDAALLGVPRVLLRVPRAGFKNAVDLVPILQVLQTFVPSSTAEEIKRAILCEMPLLVSESSLARREDLEKRVAVAVGLMFDAEPLELSEDTFLESALPHLNGNGWRRAKWHHVIRMIGKLLEVCFGQRCPDHPEDHKSFIAVAHVLVGEMTSALHELGFLLDRGNPRSQGSRSTLLPLPLAKRAIICTASPGFPGELTPEQKLEWARNFVASSPRDCVIVAGVGPCHCGTLPHAEDCPRARCPCCGCGAFDENFVCSSCNMLGSDAPRVLEVNYAYEQVEMAQVDADPCSERSLARLVFHGMEFALGSRSGKNNLKTLLARKLANKEKRVRRDALNLQQGQEDRKHCHNVSYKIEEGQGHMIPRFSRSVNSHSTKPGCRDARLVQMDFVDHREIDESNPAGRGTLAMATLFSVRAAK